MASVMAETEQKMEVTWYMGLLTPALNHVEGKYKESRLLEIWHFNSLSAASSWPHTLLARFGAAWPDGLKLASPRCPFPGASHHFWCPQHYWGALWYAEAWTVPSYSCEPKSRSRAMWGAAAGNPGCSPRKAERTSPSKAPPEPLEPHPQGTGEVWEVRLWLLFLQNTFQCHISQALHHNLMKEQVAWKKGGLFSPIFWKRKTRHGIIKDLPNVIQLREQ